MECRTCGGRTSAYQLFSSSNHRWRWRRAPLICQSAAKPRTATKVRKQQPHVLKAPLCVRKQTDMLSEGLIASIRLLDQLPDLAMKTRLPFPRPGRWDINGLGSCEKAIAWTTSAYLISRFCYFKMMMRLRCMPYLISDYLPIMLSLDAPAADQGSTASLSIR